MELLSPAGETRYQGLKDELAPRPVHFKDKVIGILSNGAGKYYLQRVEELIGKREGLSPSQIVHFSKLWSAPSTQDKLDEMARACDAVIVGTGV